MNSETEIGLENVDPEDLGDLLIKVEESFGMKFEYDELAYVTNFGQLCDHIINKIQQQDGGGCTSQQAFYKLQDELSEVLNIEKKKIIPQLSLLEILPLSRRRRIVDGLECRLGFKLNILSPPTWVIFTMMFTFLASLFLFFWDWKFAVAGLVISITGTMLSNKFGRELTLKTVGQLAEKMSRENYLKSRRNSKTVNRRELEKMLTVWFKSDLLLDKLSRESLIK